MALKPQTSLRGLRTFTVAAKHENFRIAAEELFITPSAVSHQIKGLEEELGQRLFERSGRELSLTDTGRAFYDEVQPLIEQLDSVAANYKEGGRRSLVRMSVQPFFASEYFVPRLSEFTGQNPDIDIQVGASDETSESHPADADLSIRLFRSPPAGLESKLLFPLRLVPAGSKQFLKTLRVKDGRIVSDLPLIIHGTYPKAWKQWSKAAGIELPDTSKLTRLDSMIAVVRAAEQGIGAALVPVPLADQWFHQGTIVRLFDQELVADVSYYLVWDKSDGTARPAARLRDWILQKFAADS
ncbi:MAG: LysR family transcriptional regulator [Gammaproteobacteria bacterium]|nr:LysR family transcriptional regulator [Gammaproteobacteria bacterium]